MGQHKSKSGPVSLSEHSKKIVQEVKQHPVVMYTKDSCGYCVKAKNELYEEGIKYQEKNLNNISKALDNNVEFNAYVEGLMELTRQHTVPQIFICGKFIGGYSELNALRPLLKGLVEQCSTDNGETLKRELAAKL